ncbi:MAG: type 1 glutamine amidotransferase [Spirosoma sp.]|nr:type 1 glutamine amidotransferase [Spirosoma sp.]
MNDLKGVKIAALMTEGFEQVEFTKPKQALEDAGATVHLISPKAGQIKAWNDTDWGDSFSVDLTLDAAKPDEYDALLLPGGVINPDKLRTVDKAVDFIQSFFDDQKPVAAICHAPILLIEADVVQGKQLTSYPSIQTDLRNAGANWIDQQVVTDGNLVTSRKPDDITAFNKAFIELITTSASADAQAA